MESVHDIQAWAEVITIIVSGLTGFAGLVWWMSAIYLNVKSINKSLTSISKIIEHHNKRLNNHHRRLVALESRVEEPKTEVK